ncbi:hypothetical protein M9H77_03426 [Catharanthus roseus]|uniref:Uncharacterized protein n=1 Tax=Catharanthus roseus TaxID=4058 RepID=A0ACC0CBP8_CATRO|nr:hypothetical protein M9H77_03426 [Catharanthus roseus]
MQLKIGPITRAQTKRLKIQEDNDMGLKVKKRLPSYSLFVQLARITQENNWKLKLAKYLNKRPYHPTPTVAGRLLPVELLEDIHLPPTVGHPTVAGFIMSTESQLPTQSHQERTSNPIRMNLNETLRPMQQSIE